jgi:endoglucanase
MLDITHMKAVTVKRLVPGLTLIGLLLCVTANAQIAVQDGSLTPVVSASSPISMSLTITSGARVLVVSLLDRNNKSGNLSPSSLTWTAPGYSSQTLSRIVSVNGASSTYADSDIYYLFNPNPGTATITATDTSGGTVSAMVMQAYTLSGVDTTVTPTTYSINNRSASSLSITLPASTPLFAWAVVNGSLGTQPSTVSFSLSSGVPNYIDTNYVINAAMGYVANLNAQSTSTITATGSSATRMALGVAVFKPLFAGPAAPTGLTATGQQNQVALSWSDSSGGVATGYTVWRATAGGSFSAIASLSGNANVTYTNTAVSGFVTYYYYVQAMGASGTGGCSAEASAMPYGVPTLPTGLTATPGNGAVGLTWNAQLGTTYYNVLRATSNPGLPSSYTLLGSPTSATYTDIGLVNGATYYYEVIAVNSYGTSAPSVYIGATPAIASQPSLTEIRSASPTVLVAFFKDSRWSGPVYNRSYNTNQVNVSFPGFWRLNGTPASSVDLFVTEANAVDYHVYLHVPPLTNGMAYALVTPNGSTNFVFDDSQMLCESIKVNQSGYSALSQKRFANLAVWLGSGGAQPISGPLPTYTVFDQFGGQTVTNGTLQAYAGGAQDSSSGDYVYRIDLSGVPEGGPYKVSVSGYGCSYPFGVGGDFSRRLGYVAFRALYYNRCGCPIVKPYAWANIRPYPCHTNIYDSQGPSAPDTFPSGTAQTSQPKLFVHGGHHDAGDCDRRGYHLLIPPVLMTTYEAFPTLFTDKQFNIPDQFDASCNILGSGNGIPDILDEAMWCVRFWTNMQYAPNEPSGAVAWGCNAAGYPVWGINFDQDTLLWGTETNNVDSCSLAAGIFMHMARLIRPYNAQVSADLQARGDAAYNFASSHFTLKSTHKLYFAIQKYLLTGDPTANNDIHSLYTSTSGFPGSYNKQTGGFLVDGNIWMASYFMSYILATNNPPYPLDSTVVNYFCTQLKAAADNQVSWTTNAAYPSGWRASDNPASYNYTQYYFTAEGQMAYPCLMQWALTKQQQYIDTVSLLMDYPQGLNPLGKCYMSGMGFEQTHNPQQQESAYAEWTEGLGGPIPGITVYGPGPLLTSPTLLQIPAVSGLARERIWMDDCGSYPWVEFTVEESEMFPAVVYPVLARGGTWTPAQEPFLNPAASVNVVSNGLALQFGGLPGRTYVLQAAPTVTGPWSDLSGSLQPDATGRVEFIDTSTPNQTLRFYRTRGVAPIY